VSELNILMQQIADESAISLIECCCNAVLVDGKPYFDTSTYSPGAEDGDYLQMTLRYLELRGLIVRHSACHECVAIVDQEV